MPETTADRVLDRLKDFALQSHGNEHRANSPLRPGSNSHAFKLTVDEGGENGAYFDHVSGDKGSLYDLADALGIERPADGVPVADTKRAYRDLEDYASAHGVAAEVFLKAGWQDVQPKYDYDVKGPRPALVFQTDNGPRWRFVDGNNDLAPYKHDSGYRACWYGLKRAVKMAAESHLPLVLVNGEASTVVAQHAGIPACCVTGGEKKYPAHLVAELKASYSGPVLIAFDCDGTGRRVAKQVQEQLADLETTIIDLGLGDKGDVADFCLLYGADAKERLLHRQSQTPGQATPVVSVGIDLAPLASATQALAAAMRQDARLRKQEDIALLCAQVQAQLDRVQLMHAAPTILPFAQLIDDNDALLTHLLANPDPIQGLRSHIPSLDKAVGGFTPEVYVIYGATNMGKSWLAVTLCREFIRQGAGLIVTTESKPGRWLFRLTASISKVPADLIETGQLDADQEHRVRSAHTYLRDMKCDVLANGSPTPAQVRAAFLGGLATRDYKWLIVDSGTKMSAPGTSTIYDRTTLVSDGLQSLYQEANVPVIVTTQVGRDVAERGKGKKMPQLEDAYGGGPIEHNAGVVLGLYRHQYYVDKGTEEPRADFPPTMTLARLLKNRWRGGSQVNAVKLAFVGACGFGELETRTIDVTGMVERWLDSKPIRPASDDFERISDVEF